MKKKVLFDFDGTLVDSMERIHWAVCQVFLSDGVTPPTFKDYVLEYSFPFGVYYRGLGVKLSDEEILERYLKAHGEYTPSFFGETVEVLQAIHEKGYETVVVTANSRENVRKRLEMVNLENLVDCVSASNKVEAIRELVGRSRGPKTLYVGDTVADMREAKEAGAYPVAVLRNGMMGLAQQFHKAGARICIPSLAHLTKAVPL